jgi:hypothetical protein
MKEKERYEEVKIRVIKRKQGEREWIKTEREETDKPINLLNILYIFFHMCLALVSTLQDTH